MEKVKLVTSNGKNYLVVDTTLPMNPARFKTVIGNYLKTDYEGINQMIKQMKQKQEMQKVYTQKAKEKYEKNGDSEAFQKNILWILDNFKFNETEELLFETMAKSVYGCIDSNGNWRE